LRQHADGKDVRFVLAREEDLRHLVNSVN